MKRQEIDRYSFIKSISNMTRYELVELIKTKGKPGHKICPLIFITDNTDM